MSAGFEPVPGLVGMKFSTEDEGLSPESVAARRDLVASLGVPVWLKIGGPDARADIALALRLGLAGVVAPMVETPYAIRNFGKALRATAGADRLAAGVNLETESAVHGAREILAAGRPFLTSATIGRADLASSIEARIDDARTWTLVESAAREIRAAGLPLAVGGGITPASAREVLARVAPDRIETRNCVLAASAAPDGIRAALAIEILLLEADLSAGRLPEAATRQRIAELERRRMDG